MVSSGGKVLDGLPVPLESSSLPLTERIRALTARLATPDDRFAEWASHFDLEPKALEPDQKDDLIAELDAAVSLLYGLSDRDVRHIFETFPRRLGPRGAAPGRPEALQGAPAEDMRYRYPYRCCSKYSKMIYIKPPLVL